MKVKAQNAKRKTQSGGMQSDLIRIYNPHPLGLGMSHIFC